MHLARETKEVVEFKIIFFRNLTVGNGLPRCIRPDGFEFDQVRFVVLIKVLVFTGGKITSPTVDTGCGIPDVVKLCNRIGQNGRFPQGVHYRVLKNSYVAVLWKNTGIGHIDERHIFTMDDVFTEIVFRAGSEETQGILFWVDTNKFRSFQVKSCFRCSVNLKFFLRVTQFNIFGIHVPFKTIHKGNVLALVEFHVRALTVRNEFTYPLIEIYFCIYVYGTESKSLLLKGL